MTPDEVARIAAAAHALRPDWALSSLRTFITNRYPHEPTERLACALVRCALDPAAETPARLSENPAYWRTDPSTARPHKHPPRTTEECPRHIGQYAASCASCRSERLAPTDDDLEPAGTASAADARAALARRHQDGGR